MNIQETSAFLTENSKPIINDYFQKQCRIFNLNSTSPLKDYLDFINSDPVHWFNSLPTDLQSKSAFHKYKEPIYKLLKHTKIHELYGNDYCDTIINNMKQAFITTCQSLIDDRKKTKQTISIADTTSETDSIHESDIIDTDIPEPIDIIQQSETFSKEYHYQSIINLQEKHHQEIIEYYETTIQHLKTTNQQLTTNNQQLMKLLEHFASK